jgi:hypothetical protein
LPLGLPLDALQVSHAIWAMRQPDMGGGCVFALGDYAEKMGLLNSSGRKRQAYHDYQRLSTAGSK